uniref:Folliculin-interacting protein 2-like n=1 Tax=Phallusia mammillata TaxID=59560 RepID=A0A6F9DD77_9ASCI|nr:folliculin-interacting protein 2-like [Phallusia mammillata]
MDSFQKWHKKINHQLTKCSLFRKSSQPNINTSKDISSPIPKVSDVTVFVGRPSPNVRLVLFQELGDTSDRKNIFDSKCYQKTTSIEKREVQTSHGNLHEQDQEVVKYEIVRIPSDWDVLAEMLFGSVGMVQKAPSLKVHTIRNPPQIMVSRVFCLPSFKCPNSVHSLDRRLDNHLEIPKPNQVYSRRKAQTMPVSTTPTAAIPMNKEAASDSGMHRSDSNNSLASLFSGYHGFSQSFTGSLGSGLKPMSLPNKKAHSLPPTQRDSFMLYDTGDETAPPLRQNRMRIGFAIICEPEPNNYRTFQHFFFERFPIFESHLTELKENIEKAVKIRPKQEFIAAMMKSLDVFSTKLHNVYTTQRLPEPVWSTITSPAVTSTHQDLVVRHFLSDLTRIVHHFNNKQTNYFFSGLLTATLTYHLGWVGFSSPSNNLKQNKQSEEYNTLWAQLGDLYGAVGSPTKICKTVVSGAQHEMVSTILSVISYFIQCSNLKDAVQVPDQLTPLALKHTSDPTKNLSTNLVRCDLEESEYVLVSINNGEKDFAGKLQDTSRNTVLRSKSTPFQTNIQSSLLPLNRSNSGPMVKNSSNRSGLLLNTSFSNRHRTYSNDAVPKSRPIQSRRTSNEFTATPSPKATAPKLPPKPASRHPNSPVKKGLSNKFDGAFCMRQTSPLSKFDEIEWPEVPTHKPDSPAAMKHVKSSPAIKQPTPESAGVRRVQTFVDLVEPPVTRVVNVQSSCITAASHATKPSPPSPITAVEKSPSLGHKKTRSVGDEVVIQKTTSDQVSAKDRTSPARSVSNPSANTKKKVCGEVRDAAAVNGNRCKLGTRRHALPSSPTQSKTINSEVVSSEEMESPSLQRLKLMRIPSIEINHNAFEEYFDDMYSKPAVAKQVSSDISNKPNPVPLPRQSTSGQIKSPPPLLPSKGPVGVVSFKACSEEVKFHEQNQHETPVSVNRPVISKVGAEPSSTSLISADLVAKEIPVSDMKSLPKSSSVNQFSPEWDSLMADFNAEYLNDFVLHGVPNQPDLPSKILKDLHHTVRNPPLDEPVSEAVCIHADVDSCTVKVYSSQRLHSDKPSLTALTSKLVSNIVQQVAHMSAMKVSPQFCMAHLEGELRQLVLKSRMLAEYVRGHKRVTVAQLSAVLGIESQDLPLLMSIASCHSPHVAPAML